MTFRAYQIPMLTYKNLSRAAAGSVLLVGLAMDSEYFSLYLKFIKLELKMELHLVILFAKEGREHFIWNL